MNRQTLDTYKLCHAQTFSGLSLLALALTGLLVLATVSYADVETADVASGFFKHRFELGYRVVDDSGDTQRAGEYDDQNNSTTAGVEIAVVDDWGHFNLEGSYVTEKDFGAEAHLQAGPEFSFDIYTQSLFHNLDHIDYTSRHDAYEVNAPTIPVPGVDSPTIDFTDQNPGDIYGVKTQISQATTKIKLGSLPGHVTLGYWSMEQDGKRQQRFLEESCSGCHMQSRSRSVDQTVEEFSLGTNMHLGPIDIIAEQVFRQFDNRATTPVDDFGSHFRQRTAGTYEHDEIPDARYRATTLKLHTSLAGGLTAAASGTYGKRENESELTQVSPVNAETEFYKVATDLSWTPATLFTLDTHYRYLDLDYEHSSYVLAPGTFFGAPVPARESIDQTVQSVLTRFSLRPIANWKIKAEGEWREIDRETRDPQTGTELWNVPEDETRVRYKLGLYGHTANGRTLKLRSWAQYTDSSDPAYGTSFDTRQTLFVGVDYNPTRAIGLSFNGKYEQAELEDFLTSVDNGANLFLRDRTQGLSSINGMAWYRPLDNLELGMHYGYQNTRVTEDLIFGTDSTVNPPGTGDLIVPAKDSDYEQTSETLGLFLDWRLLKNLASRLEGRVIRTKAEFTPYFTPETLYYDGGAFASYVSWARIGWPSRIDMVQYGGSASLNLDAANSIEYGLTYNFDRYDDRCDENLDGTVQSIMATVAKSW